MPFDFSKIEGIRVVLEFERSTVEVGVLTKDDQEFYFEYNRQYLISPQRLSLGPEMPLTRPSYRSKELFNPFKERIPSRENPAYNEYCLEKGISSDERDPFILLATIASRGPSSFLFFPIYSESFSREDLRKFRKALGLSTREFALCFDFSQPGITRVETGKTDGREILKRVEIYASYPKVACDQLKRRSWCLHYKKMENVMKVLARFGL